MAGKPSDKVNIDCGVGRVGMTLQRTPRYYECFVETSVGEVRINQDYIGGLDGEKAPVTVLIMVCILL